MTLCTARSMVLEALNHQEPARVPMDFGATSTTGISVSVVYRLRQALGLDEPDTPVKVVEPYQMLGEIASDLRSELGIDCAGVFKSRNMFGFTNSDWKSWRLADGTPVLVPGAFNTQPEPNGDILQYPEGDTTARPSGRMPRGGFYFDTIVRQPPIDENALCPDDNLEEFSTIGRNELEHMRTQTSLLSRNSDPPALVGNFSDTGFGDIALIPAPFLPDPKGIRDIEEWYISTITRKDYVREVFARQTELALENLETVHAMLGDAVDILYITGTDFGTQRGPFVSSDCYREVFKPFHQRVNNWVHTNTTWKTFMHSCGGVEPLIDEFIDAGFDILNPVQCSADGMDPETLKREYGKRITFWGGGVDTQKTLAFGSPAEVRDEVRARVEVFAEGGGFVFNAIHNIQATTPIENVLAMFDAFSECR